MDADADIDRLTSLPSLCMHCQEEGETRLLLTSIPYFRDVIIMSFSCPHCSFTSNEVQPASEIQPFARRFILSVNPSDSVATRRDLDRQLIKSETAVVRIPEIDFEIGATGVRGDINTIEGVLGNVCDSLEVGQANRALADVEVWRKVAGVIEEVRRMKEGERPFTFVIDDLAGNSYIENPYAPAHDPRVKLETYPRTRQETEGLGYAQEAERAEEEKKFDEATGDGRTRVKVGGVEVQDARYEVAAEVQDRVDTYFNVSDRSAILQGQCTSCHRECETRMAVTDIPHFKEVVLMTTSCDNCGYRDTEVKPAGRVSEKAIRITVRVETVEDLKRDLLKSDTSSISIPQLELDMIAGTLGGKYTTLEGILGDIKGQLGGLNPFHMGDSSEVGQKGAWKEFMDKLDGCIQVVEPFTLIVEDPLGNSWVWSEEGEGKDPKMTVERYERTWEQNEELGLNDVDVEVEEYATEEDQQRFKEEMEREERMGGGAVDRERKRQAEEVERKRVHDGTKEGKVGGKIHITDDSHDR